MKDVLMYTDTEKFNESIKRCSVCLCDLTSIYEAFNAMELGSLTSKEFEKLVLHPAEVIFDRLTNGQDVVIGGLKINKAKALELWEKPKGYDTLIDLISHFKGKQNWQYYLDMGEIDGNEIALKASVIEREKEASKVYATTEKERKVFEFAKGIIALAEEKFGGKNPDLTELIPKIISSRERVYGSREWEYHIKAHEIKGVNLHGRV